MTTSPPMGLEGLKERLKEAARAHHAATGGVNDDWALWYAEYLEPRIAADLGAHPSVAVLAEWLATADAEYRAEERGMGWPRYYATRFFEWADAT